MTENALQHILRFMKYFVKLLGTIYKCPALHKVSDRIPLKVITAEKILGIHDREVIEYVVCPSCHSIYSYEDCILTVGNGQTQSKLCQHIKYPNHPHPSKRKPCGTVLLKTVSSKKGNKLIPNLIYPYCPIHVSFQRLALRPGFLRSCEKWRDREYTIPSGFLGDVYDGRVWQSFKQSNFLSSPYSYLLSLNIDWFQPFKNVEYSVGAIYLTVQNLPRQERFKEANIMLVGIIPGPREPALSVNSYLLPLIEELKIYYEGIFIITPQRTRVTARLALSCISCDIPATRKLCGFLSHNARLGCNKCFKEFKVGPDSPSDFSGYDRTKWKPRTAEVHRQDCMKLELEVTKSGIRATESKFGVRSCALLQLSYYDPIRFVAIDLMHNLFLGTAKHMFSTWISLELLTKEDLSTIGNRVKQFVVPSNLGRLPLQIESNYLRFKAAQWSVWITIYSPVVLRGILPDEHYKCWLMFVRACAILTQRIVRVTEIETADKLLELFCKKVQTLYGHAYCTPNMHLHLHLKDTLLDYGLAHATWCYSFERYNGMLGSILTNNKSIESQLMQRFVRNQQVQSLSDKVDDSDLANLVPKINAASAQLTLSSSVSSDTELLNLLKLSRSQFDPVECSYKDVGCITLLGTLKELVFSADEISLLHSLYQQLNPSCIIEYVPPFYGQYDRLSLGGDILGSNVNNRSARSSSVIAAYWSTRGNIITQFDHSRASIGKVMYYFSHSVTLRREGSASSEIISYTMALVRWMDYHHENSLYGITATVCANMFKEPSLCCFIPVLRICAKCASCIININHETVFVACPIPIKLSM